MILLELALQGVKGFPAVVRLPLKPGVNVASSATPDQRRALLDAVYHCLYADSARASATEHLVAPGAVESRIALTFYGRDKVTYRLIREAVHGAMKLYRFDAEAKKYRLFSDVTNDVAQFVRVQQQLPDDVTYERLFLFAADAMPSKGDRARTRSGAPLVRPAPAPSAPGLPADRYMSGVMGRASSVPGALPNALEGSGGHNPNNALVLSQMAMSEAEADDDLPESTEERRALLLRLRADLDAVTRAKRAQSEIDQIAARKFEINERVESIRELEQRVGQLELQPADDGLENMPPNLADRLRSFEAREARFQADEAKILEELGRMEQEAEGDLVLPLIQDRYFQVSVSLAALFVVLALALSKPFIALLNVPAALVALGAALRYVADLEREAKRRVRLSVVEERLDRLHKQRDLDTGVTRRMMTKLEIDSPAELLERVEQHEARLAELETLRGNLAAQRNDPAVNAELQELDQLERRVASLEAEVAAAAGITDGQAQLEWRVRALEEALGPDVPPRIKSPPLGLGSDGIESSARDLAADLVAQSAFSSHVTAQSPLATGEHAVPSPRGVSTSSVFPPPRGTSGLGITGDLPSSVPPTSGLPAFQGPGDTGGGVPVVRGTSDTGSMPPRPSGSSAPAPQPSSAGRSFTPQLGLPAFPGPARPLAPPAGPPPTVAPSAPGLPTSQTGPVVPKTEGASNGLFDFGGGLIGEDEDEDDPRGGPKGDDEGSGGQQAQGYLAMGSGFAGFGGSGGGGGYSEGGEAALPDRSRELVEATTDLLSLEVDALAEKLAPRLAQYLQAFTGGRFEGAELGARGEVTLRPAEGEPVLFRELEGEDLDPVDAALRFTLAEFVVRKYRIPLLVEDPFADLDDKRRKLMAQMLGYFARATQVLVLSERDDLPGHPLSLKG